jgi:hypothetical protein
MSETKTTKKDLPKHTIKNNIVLKIANTEIIVGKTYEVVGKRDADAPSGFIENNTSKFLMADIAEIRGVPFDEDLQKYDTGFDEDSPCNSKIPSNEVGALVALYNKHIKEPYEKSYNKNVSSSNEEFWLGSKTDIDKKTYNYVLSTNMEFNTSKPKDLFDLFHALKQGRICEQGEKDSALQKANYCIKDKERLLSLQEEKTDDKFEASFLFRTLLDATTDETDSLYTILEWIGLMSIRGSDKGALKKTVQKLFDNPATGYESAKKFLEAHDLSISDRGKEKMELFSMLSKLRAKNKLEFKRHQFYLEDNLLGNHLKGAAEKAVLDPKTKELIINNYESYCS